MYYYSKMNFFLLRSSKMLFFLKSNKCNYVVIVEFEKKMDGCILQNRFL